MKRIEPSKRNLIVLRGSILNNKTLKAAFIEFAQNGYTYEQVKGFYYKYKEPIFELGSEFHRCYHCGKFFYFPHKEIITNKYSHFGLRRVFDAVITLGFSERINYTVAVCPICGATNVIHSKINW